MITSACTGNALLKRTSEGGVSMGRLTVFCFAVAVGVVAPRGSATDFSAPSNRVRIWDDAELKRMTLPPAQPEGNNLKPRSKRLKTHGTGTTLLL